MSLPPELVRNLMRVELPPTPARAGWRISHDELCKAMDCMNIQFPVKIRFMSGRYRFGTHYAWEGYHRITLNQNLSALEANESLWHELAHASQSEDWARRSGTSISQFYSKEYAHIFSKGEWGATYENNKYEIDARKIASTNFNWKLVTW
jgi:hypothetical protein